MKCVRNIETQKITRVDNEQAARKVREGTHEYVNKQTWKQEVRDK